MIWVLDNEVVIEANPLEIVLDAYEVSLVLVNYTDSLYWKSEYDEMGKKYYVVELDLIHKDILHDIVCQALQNEELKYTTRVI